jgi:hypothetical protein
MVKIPISRRAAFKHTYINIKKYSVVRPKQSLSEYKFYISDLKYGLKIGLTQEGEGTTVGAARSPRSLVCAVPVQILCN